MTDTGSNGLRDSIRKSTGFRLMVLFFTFFVFLIISAGIAAVLVEVPCIGERGRILISSALQCVLAFCLPAWLAARFACNEPWRFLGVSTPVSVRPFFGVVIVYILALPAMNQLIAWNEAIHFPEWASGLESTLRGWEEANGAIAEKVLASDGIISMLTGILVVGMLTGFSEELFFRGAMQKIFQDSGIMPGLAVWSAAVIFSAVHFQFFGFFPRMLMGAFFGYLLLWTGSLWPGVFAHALNNSIVVVGAWIAGSDSLVTVDSFGIAGEGEVPWGAITSFAATAIFFWQFRKWFFKTSPRSGR